MFRVAPAPGAAARARPRAPVPGQSPLWCSEIMSTARVVARRPPACRCRGGRPSRGCTRARDPAASAARAATATAFVRQNPIGRGRARVMARRPHGAERRGGASAHAPRRPPRRRRPPRAAPRASSPGRPRCRRRSSPLAPRSCSSAARYSARVHALELGRASPRAPRARCSSTPAARAPASAAVSRAGDSGCPPGWTCACASGCESSRTATDGRYRAGQLPKCDVFACKRFEGFAQICAAGASRVTNSRGRGTGFCGAR